MNRPHIYKWVRAHTHVSETVDLSILRTFKNWSKNGDLNREWTRLQKGSFPDHAQTKEIVSVRKGITWKLLGQTLRGLRFPFFQPFDEELIWRFERLVPGLNLSCCWLEWKTFINSAWAFFLPHYPCRPISDMSLGSHPEPFMSSTWQKTNFLLKRS